MSERDSNGSYFPSDKTAATNDTELQGRSAGTAKDETPTRAPDGVTGESEPEADYREHTPERTGITGTAANDVY